MEKSWISASILHVDKSGNSECNLDRKEREQAETYDMLVGTMLIIWANINATCRSARKKNFKTPNYEIPTLGC